MEVIPSVRCSRNLVTNEVYRKVEECLHRISGHDPRPAQTEAIIQMIYGRHDVLLQAATGYGKSVIWQMTGELTVLLTGKRYITIMISPLNSLTKQQVETVNQLAGRLNVKAVAVTAQNCDNKLYNEIADGQYTHGTSTDYTEHQWGVQYNQVFPE
jgi:superfamily II DNA helicase RecQ